MCHLQEQLHGKFIWQLVALVIREINQLFSDVITIS